MAQVTTTVEAKIRGITVSADGKTVNVTVEWVDTQSKDVRARAPLAITGGQVSQFGKSLGTAPAKLAELAAAVASLVQGTVDGLVTSGSLKY